MISVPSTSKQNQHSINTRSQQLLAKVCRSLFCFEPPPQPPNPTAPVVTITASASLHVTATTTTNTMGFTGVNTNNMSFTPAQAAALRVTSAQHAVVQAQAAFTSAFTDVKNAVPGAKATADKAGADLKAAQAEFEEAQKVHEAAQATATDGMAIAHPSKTADALSSSSTTNLPFDPPSAFKDPSTMTSLATFPAIPAFPCGNKACARSAATRTLPACPHNIAAAFEGCKDLAVVRGHLHASRFTDSSDEVKCAAKEVYAVVNDLVMNHRGGAFGGAGGRKGQKNFAGQGFAKGSRGRKC